MSEEMIPVHPDEPMKFECNAQNKCFNECCRDLSQALTPYDVLRLKNNLGISSQQFLREYTSRHIGPESGLPMIEFKANPETGHACPFVRPEGCSVYPDRPGSCRMYPLARAIAFSRETGQINEYFALIEEAHCKGFGKDTGQSVRDWLKGQDVDTHNINNDKLMELISLKNRILPGMLDPVQADQFYLGLYDIDEFRQQIFEQDLLAGSDVSPAVLDSIKKDDEALLDFGIQWVKYRLFGIQPDVKGGL